MKKTGPKFKGKRREIGEDFFETPREAILPIKSFIPHDVKVIWECTYGKGAIGNVLEEWGYEVVMSDMYPKVEGCPMIDFLGYKESVDCDMLIFNPPFSLKTEFLEKACQLNKPFLFICPVTILETRTRYELFKKYQLSIINLPNRVNYSGKPGVWFHSVWVGRLPDHKSEILTASS